MKPISNLRLLIIAAVAVIAMGFTIPTVRYYLDLQNKPEVTGSRPFAAEARPAADKVEELAAWQAKYPDVVKWEAEHPDYVKWEEHNEELRAKAIPLGLDLLGGVDVTLKLDRDQMIKQEIELRIDKLKEDLGDQQISATFDPLPAQEALRITLEKKEDARNVANLLANYSGSFDREVSEDELAAGPVVIKLDTNRLNDDLSQSIEGAKRGISDRVNSLGVTQPRISLQGNDRIRVQVPGEKNPDRLLRTVIRPAFLEFRLVDAQNNQLVDPQTGDLREGANLPTGTELVDAKLADYNNETHQVEYKLTKMVVRSRAYVTGDELRNANVFYNPSDFQNPIQVSIEFNPEGAAAFGKVTSEYAGSERQLAIMLDGVVRSAPRINEPITDGRAVITGGFTNEEATDLAQLLKAGSIKAPLVVEAKRAVGSSLGQESILASVEALVVGAAIIMVFMILYYGMAGVISIIALVLNVLIILAVMAMAKATLTLSGIGGILLTIGMAVDANVLIYERIREELVGGRPLRQAIGQGFGRAFTVILDSNLTTILTALVLLQFTDGSVQGFALTMTFGLLANLFTGLTVTYTLCSLWFTLRGTLSMKTFLPDVFHGTKIDFISMRKLTLPLSATVLIVSLVLVIAKGGLQYSVDFAGGSRTEVQFSKEVSEAAISKALADSGLGNASIQPVMDQANMFIVDVNLIKLAEGEVGALEKTEATVHEALTKSFPEPGAFTIELQSGFGPQTAQEFTDLAILVIILASCAILVYLWFRFELVFGVAAVLALIHDLMIVTLLCTLWNVQISLEVVAALMVLLGFSVNDTIVIFDRIRENTRTLTGKKFGEICNLAMNQSLSRTIITGGTTFFAVVTLFLIGGEGLRPFAKVLIMGVIVGTYSSDFLAAPIVYMWNAYKGNRLQQSLAAKKARREKAQPVRSAGAATRVIER